MAEGGAITFDELFGQDIEQGLLRLDKNLTDLQSTIAADTKLIKELAESLKAEGRITEDTAKQVEKLVEAYSDVKMAESTVAKDLAIVNQQLKTQEKQNKLNAAVVVNLADSYAGLKAQLAQNINSYQNMSKAERDSTAGQELLKAGIQGVRAEIDKLDGEMRKNIAVHSTLEKAQERLAYLQSEEGVQFAEVSAQIRQLNAERREAAKTAELQSVSETAAVGSVRQLEAEIKLLTSELSKMSSLDRDYGVKSEQLAKSKAELKRLNAEQKEATKLAELDMIIGSERITQDNMLNATYAQLSAQLQKNQIELSKKTVAEQSSDEATKQLVEDTKALNDQLKAMDAGVGNYKRNVGNYDGALRKLKLSATQTISELPAMTISMNTFFLAISNNVPMMLEQIKAVKAMNEELKAAGKATISVGKAISSVIFSWTTAAVVLLSIISNQKFKDAIADFFGSFRKGAISMEKAAKRIRRELKNTNDDFSKSAAQIRVLSEVWNELSTDEERIKFLGDYKEQLDKTGISIKSLSDAEKVFTDYTNTIVEAFAMRAKYAAAMKKAEETSEKAVKDEVELLDINTQIGEQEEKNASLIEKRNELLSKSTRDPIEEARLNAYNAQLELLDELYKKRDKLQKQVSRNMADTEVYIKLGAGYMKQEQALYDEAGVKTKEQMEKEAKRKDLVNRVNNMILKADKRNLKLQVEAYEEGYDKRKKALENSFAEEREEIETQIAEIEHLLEKEDLNLTPEQKQQLSERKQLLVDSLNPGGSLGQAQTLASLQFEKEETAKRVRMAQERVALTLEAIKEGSEEEFRLRKELIQKQMASEIAENATKEAALQASVIDIRKKYLKRLEDLEYEHSLNLAEIRIERIESEQEGLRLGTEQYAYESHQKQLEKIEAERAKAILENSHFAIEARKKEADINAKYDNETLKETTSYNVALLKLQENAVDRQLELAKKGSDAEYKLILAKLELQRKAEIEANKAAESPVDEYEINQKYDKLTLLAYGSFVEQYIDETAELVDTRFQLFKRSAQEIERHELQTELATWREKIKLAKEGALQWSAVQIEIAEATVENLKKRLEELTGWMASLERISEHGLLGIFDMTDEQYDALDEAFSTIGDNLSTLAGQYAEMAQAAVQAAETQVSAAQSVYEAELEARANGYANSVDSARKELDLERSKLAEKQAMLERSQRAQEAADTVSQISSLITASANMWKAFSSIPYVGTGLAIAAISTMFGSFTAAKIQAKNLAGMSQQYGEGGLEFLEGGSHASGHDIDLGVVNKQNRRMVAEGGEALAIINRRNTKKYAGVLPDIIDSLNKGVFEDRYLNAFTGADGISILNQQASVDLSLLERQVGAIREQGDTQMCVLPDGTVLIKKGNVTRYIKN